MSDKYELLPTAELRFVRRTVIPCGDVGHKRVINILQQRWFNEHTGAIRWQDVPLIDEPASDGEAAR